MGAGTCSALIADAADELGPADAMGCGRAVVMPEMGSVLVAGHSPLGALVLRAAHAASLPLGVATPFGWGSGAEAVEPVEACDESDVEEFVRWALRGTKMAPPLGAPSALHGCRLMFWYWTGGATAVIGNVVGVAGRRCAQGRFCRDSRVPRS
jgi:hypothetical protein